eukprot:CAMPEP_0175863434 /NCGR_PEP_ID=MMETSP0107_2-20121207/32487_1 /TAXON_ID=195067 ORGANISM="Goniomonas pacifica, Strain CCMP1869" /NCGR_SAMPLE_ID=MMETSP0107_2 /ASSEMBLY_ACC=CAM_ASM_000203 /LENGTH=122 /DNA_ID=CAMNT_0017180521 /DNA_START=121 /DNA_END=489 /DNA_ORIENTATION=+
MASSHSTCAASHSTHRARHCVAVTPGVHRPSQLATLPKSNAYLRVARASRDESCGVHATDTATEWSAEDAVQGVEEIDREVAEGDVDGGTVDVTHSVSRDGAVSCGATSAVSDTDIEAVGWV